MARKRSLAILRTTPLLGVPGGELIIECRGFVPDLTSKVFCGESEASIVSASQDRIIVRLPESPNSLGLALKRMDAVTEVFPFNLATRLAGGLHPVSNPAVAPDGTLITTISGSRGQPITQPLVRISKRGDKIPFHCDIMNPTGLAFSPDGQLYVSSRHDGTVFRYKNFERLELVAEELGIPCGIIFDSVGRLYVGDRTGKIYRIDSSGAKEEFARLEPSISAYHLAMDGEDRLYVTGPTFSLRDSLYRFSRNGSAEVLVRGLARPQGMAFLPDGALLISAGFQGKKGIFRYSPKNDSLEHFITAPMLVGLAVSRKDVYLATGNSIFRTQLTGQDTIN
jgi:sugar lactone lactonase YvrE